MATQKSSRQTARLKEKGVPTSAPPAARVQTCLKQTIEHERMRLMRVNSVLGCLDTTPETLVSETKAWLSQEG
jgi:hypothetical protein